MLITFEGLDSSGKSTQAQIMSDRLKDSGSDVMLIREPGGTPLSEHLRTLLLDRIHLSITSMAEFMMFSASRAQLTETVIRPALEKKSTVICDRFYDSSTAYQGWGRGLPVDQIKRVNSIVTGGLKPDLTLFLDIPVKEVVGRKISAGYGTDRIESAGSTFYTKVREGYLALIREEPERIRLVDGMQPIMDIHDQLWKVIQSLGIQEGKLQ